MHAADVRMDWGLSCHGVSFGGCMGHTGLVCACRGNVVRSVALSCTLHVTIKLVLCCVVAWARDCARAMPAKTVCLAECQLRCAAKSGL